MSGLILDAYEALMKAKSAKGTNKKIEILKTNMSHELKYVLEHATSPYINFGIKQYSFGESIGTTTIADEKWNILTHVLHKLKVRAATGDEAKRIITELSQNLNEKQQHLLKCILDKDLEIGIGAKNVNKVYPGLIPEFHIQLAHSKNNKMTFPCIAEIKRNGVRNVSIINQDEVKHYSRAGREQPYFDFLNEELLKFACGMPLVVDGEIHGIHKDHRMQYKMAQEAKAKNKKVDTSKLRFTIFDMMPLGAWTRKACSVRQKERSSNLLNYFNEYFENPNMETTQLCMSRQWAIQQPRDLDALFTRIIKQGHEGLIIKDPDALYEFKRSHAWQKMKCKEDAEFEIVEVLEGKKAMHGMVGSVVVKTPGGTSNAGMKGFSHEELKKMWKNRKKFIGKMATIEYMNVTKDGNLYLPKFLHIRDEA